MTDAAPDAASGALAPAPRRVVVVTGLSGAGKSSILRVLEDLGYETVDNPPLSVLGGLVAEPGEAPLAVGVDARTRGFDAPALASGLEALRRRGDLRLEVVFATADEDALLRRYSETRRRHPLAPDSAGVAEGIAREVELTDPLREAADWVLDTTGLPLPELRRMVERRLGPEEAAGAGGLRRGMLVSLRSFAYPAGLPRDADLVFDMRFLQNPHYDPRLRPLTGRDAAVAAFIEADPDFAPFWDRMTALLDLLLPRYVAEGKKYLTVALGCTGGKHRSVLAAERLAARLAGQGWRVDLSHRELRLPAARVGEGGPSTAPGPGARAMPAGGEAGGVLEGPEARTVSP
ncbi:RNase adapter RapZ [Roseomonas sp. OT10]|uniref:RNase adapter RapZ n=1 Tax=Roseomonas cutis TaxID=2897332 RepID=UPI001E2F428F|nr:RNase adapter RapZ [Roseomonas sp. OT10]UFN49007.1 RNase adapter RapZ [Roseomonas sp. OT10]